MLRYCEGIYLGGDDRARMSLHPPQRDRDGRANGVGWDRRRQHSVIAAAPPPFFQPTGDVMRPMGMFGSTMAMAPARRNHRHHGGRH